MKLACLNDRPEIFHTIQGEGKSLGKPSVFVRLSLCNLHCVWCDTDYTWNWKGTTFKHNYDEIPDYAKYDKKAWIIELNVEEINNIIQSFNCKNVVITGGEPLLQQNELATLCRTLKSSKEGFEIEIETNGTIIPNISLDPWVDQYNVSPKLKNSGNSDHLRIKPKVLDFFGNNSKAYFKYVIESTTDLEEVLSMVKGHTIRTEQVFLMPQGVSAEELKKKRIWLVEACKKYGFNYTDRLHIHIWGNKRGV
ncbi:7-carboxy-7-deazaguanine synthase QueE [Fulvivirga sp. M361]|uniref:7-carboxy-7-deazaguanine synthase QueE n=1 Tax=Fulvivirga sp. M361 TaxID=2594266 RepID=UPI00117B4025|nr:7-carboxy-7-deazaguanine synthase QueE [Fulvivirga sp. M361]TRX52681.1 7-carboxy-7-deazaguanine synthase QueE [Fulvivirga sp. M361]